MKTSSILALTASLGLATAAQAALLLQENFDALTAGELGGKSSWTAQTGVTVSAGGLSYNPIGGSIAINGGANRVQSNSISPNTATPLATKTFTPAQSGDVWFSFTMLVDSSVPDSRYWFWVSDTTNLNTGITGSVGDNNQSNKNFFSEIRLTTSPSSVVGGTIAEDSVYFFVARLSKDGGAIDTSAYDRMEVWVNPTSTSLSGGIVANAPANATFTGGIQYFGLTALNSVAALQWDNLRIGTEQADVLDIYSTSNIPEPSAFAALAGLAGLGLAATRRRRA